MRQTTTPANSPRSRVLSPTKLRQLKAALTQSYPRTRFQFDWVLNRSFCNADVDALLGRAQFVPGKDARLKRMKVSGCHDNAAKLATTHRGWSWFYGMALSDDGCWRVHSWALTTKGRIVETTKRREVYWGLDARETGSQLFRGT